jgi:hypothetical protein
MIKGTITYTILLSQHKAGQVMNILMCMRLIICHIFIEYNCHDVNVAFSRGICSNAVLSLVRPVFPVQLNRA